ncbi:hypothetical protein [Rubrivivax gelatinosus]|nr:hypothetical protein [Rubrivivax gelatinosus]
MGGNNTAPAAISQTKPHNRGALTPVDVTPPRKVSYVFQAVSAGGLSIPYAVAVDGVVLAEFAQKARRVSGDRGRFSVTVRQGQRVSLYLNSDAAAQWRQHPVYAVTAGERDVVVQVTEKMGKHADTDTPVRQNPDADAGAVDLYAAPLTGDVWMKVSHLYTPSEIDARLPANVSEAVKAAVKRIYSGLGSATLVIDEPPTAQHPARRLQITFTDSENPRQNISRYSLLADGLPRSHPAGYAALFSAALEADVGQITLASCWRPMLGSIGHRAGLGLDVSVLGGTVLNRQELRRAFEGKNGTRRGNGNDRDNVTDAEVAAFGAHEEATKLDDISQAEVKAARAALKNATEAGNASVISAAKDRLAKASDAADKTNEAQIKTRNAWDETRKAGEPHHVQRYRASLLKCTCVRQLFDPWVMDIDTRDAAEPEPNMQKTRNETTHAHHLHITVDEPRIL